MIKPESYGRNGKEAKDQDHHFIHTCFLTYAHCVTQSIGPFTPFVCTTPLDSFIHGPARERKENRFLQPSGTTASFITLDLGCITQLSLGRPRTARPIILVSFRSFHHCSTLLQSLMLACTELYNYQNGWNMYTIETMISMSNYISICLSNLRNGSNASNEFESSILVCDL